MRKSNQIKKRKPFYLRKSFTGEYGGVYYVAGKYNHRVETRKGIKIRFHGKIRDRCLTAWLKRAVIGSAYKGWAGTIGEGGKITFNRPHVTTIYKEKPVEVST